MPYDIYIVLRPDAPATEPAAGAALPVDHLGDFTATPRLLLITCLALPVGVISAGLAWALLRLIGLITNAVF